MRVVQADLEGLVLAADAVKGGKVICYPTDTVYGLGCDPFNQAAVERVMLAKGRGTKAMPVLVRTIEDAERLVSLSHAARRIARKFWPGPVSIVLPAKGNVPSILAPDRTLAVRCPRNAVCQQLLAMCSGMLVGTSANLTGSSPAKSAEEVVKQLDDRVDIVLDAGKPLLGVASTVVDLTKKQLAIVREGPVGKREILKALKSRELL